MQTPDDPAARFAALTARAGELAADLERVADERALIAATWHAGGLSFARIAELAGVTRARAQQLVERGRKQLA